MAGESGFGGPKTTALVVRFGWRRLGFLEGFCRRQKFVIQVLVYMNAIATYRDCIVRLETCMALFVADVVKQRISSVQGKLHCRGRCG